MLSRQIYWLIRIVISRSVILGFVELSRINRLIWKISKTLSLSMSLPGGTGRLKYSLAFLLVMKPSICGVLDVSLLNWFYVILSFKANPQWISFKKCLELLDFRINKKSVSLSLIRLSSCLGLLLSVERTSHKRSVRFCAKLQMRNWIWYKNCSSLIQMIGSQLSRLWNISISMKCKKWSTISVNTTFQSKSSIIQILHLLLVKLRILAIKWSIRISQRKSKFLSNSIKT